MAPQLNIDPSRTAVLILHYQNEIVARFASTQPELLNRAAAVARAARQAGIPLIYLVARFREGYPEVSPRNKTFSALKEAGHLREGTKGAEVPDAVAPQSGDVLVTGRRVGAFATTDMETVLKARDITSLVLLGISTSGVVLTTVRWAFDLDYDMLVLADCCADDDEEVHRVLTQKVLPSQATVANSQDFLQALGRS